MRIDFRDLEKNEKVSQVEAMDFVSPIALVDEAIERRSAIDNGIRLPWQKFDGLFAMREGELVLMGGYSGHFKSTLGEQMALAAIQQGFKTAIASLELMPSDVVEHLSGMAAVVEQPAEDWMRKFADYLEGKAFIYNCTDPLTPDQAIQLIAGAAIHKGCKFIVLDCLMMAGLGDDYEAERHFAQTLAKMAKRYKICILLIHHARKPTGEAGEKSLPSKYSFHGSSMLTNTAASIITVLHDKEKAAKRANDEPFDDDYPDLMFCIAKQRHGKYESAKGLWQHHKSRAFCATSQRKLQAVML